MIRLPFGRAVRRHRRRFELKVSKSEQRLVWLGARTALETSLIATIINAIDMQGYDVVSALGVVRVRGGFE